MASEMIDLSQYTLQKAEKSLCGNCGHHVHWLTVHEKYINDAQHPDMFILCENCGMIVKAGCPGFISPPENRNA